MKYFVIHHRTCYPSMPLLISKIIVFLLTFLAYAGLHGLRAGWANSKDQIRDSLGVSQQSLGLIDTLYLISYSGGMALLGSFIHKVSLKWYVIVGLILSTLTYVTSAVLYSLFSYFNLIFLIILMSLNGFFQATGWPGLMGIFGNWFAKNKKGVLMGIWATNAGVGNIIAQTLITTLQNNGYSWTLNFFLTALLGLVVAGLMILFLKEKPSTEQIQSQKILLNEQQKEEAQKSILSQESEPKDVEDQVQSPKCGIFSALLLPRVPNYVIGYAMLKGCIYGLLFWLPLYLTKVGLTAEKGYIAAMIDIGALFGGTLVGFLADRSGKRALFLSPLLFVSSALMFVVAFSLTNIAWEYYVTMFIIGCMIGGPYNIIGTVIAIDMGQQSKGKISITTVSSLIEGSAAFFAAISQLIIPMIAFEFVFYLFAAECIIAGAVLLPPFFKELKEWRAPNQAEPNQIRDD